MFQIRNLTDNDNIMTTEKLGPFQVLEYITDLSVAPQQAVSEYFASAMNVRKRQVLCDLRQTGGVRTQAGAMQWMLGDVSMTSGVHGVGGLISNAFKGKMSGESAVKPEYTGKGLLALEPTYKHILLEDLDSWNGAIVVEDGMFLAAETQVNMEIVMRQNLSSAAGGKEGLFNLCMSGRGAVCLESPYPRGELVEITLDNDVIKIDGNMAVCWSRSLSFTVERSARTLLGSAMSGEGLVNVYRGTGKILMAPVA